MEVLAALNLGDFAQIFSKMGMFPVFDLAYYIVSILYLKYEPGECVSHFSVGFKCTLFFHTKGILYYCIDMIIYEVYCLTAACSTLIRSVRKYACIYLSIHLKQHKVIYIYIK